MCFAGNFIGDYGAKQLAKSLANSTTLASLDLSGAWLCSMTPALVWMCIHSLSSPSATSHPNTNGNPYLYAVNYTFVVPCLLQTIAWSTYFFAPKWLDFQNGRN